MNFLFLMQFELTSHPMFIQVADANVIDPEAVIFFGPRILKLCLNVTCICSDFSA